MSNKRYQIVGRDTFSGENYYLEGEYSYEEACRICKEKSEEVKGYQSEGMRDTFYPIEVNYAEQAKLERIRHYQKLMFQSVIDVPKVYNDLIEACKGYSGKFVYKVLSKITKEGKGKLYIEIKEYSWKKGEHAINLYLDHPNGMGLSNFLIFSGSLNDIQHCSKLESLDEFIKSVDQLVECSQDD